MRPIAVVVVSVLAAGMLAACGDAKQKATEGGPVLASAQIRSAYETFFSGKTSIPDRVAVLQNGPKFKAVVASFASNPLAKNVSVKVDKVGSIALQGGTGTAGVVYTVKLGGTALPMQKGTAVLENGHWKVGSASLCKLVALGGTTPVVCLYKKS